MSNPVLTSVAIAIGVVWVYSAFRARRFHRKGASPYVLFCMSPLLAGVAVLLRSGLAAILLASVVIVPTTLRALTRLVWKREIQVHLVRSEEVEEDIAVRWITTTYRPDYRLTGKQAVWYWVDQMIIGLVLYGGLLILVLFFKNPA